MDSALKELKDALQGSDVDAINQKVEGLMSASQTFAQRLYEQAAAENAPPSSDGASAAGDEDEVVDAEIVDEQGA